MNRIDQITDYLTAYRTFDQLVAAGMTGFSPSLTCRPARRTDRHIIEANAMKVELADAFDAAMVAAGRANRAFRG